jgi:HK97 family phage portal protein
MQQPPNRLGQTLNYFAEAYRFAFAVPQKASPRRGMAMSFLDAMANSTKYRDNSDTVDTAEAVKLAITSAWFYSGVKLIADRIASADARPTVKKRVGAELRDMPGHDFDALLAQPNSLMTTEFILRYTTFWAYLTGNAYIFISTPAPGQGKPEELWPLPANKVRPLPTSIRSSRLTGQPCIDYAYKADDRQDKWETLPGENVIHIRFPNPFDYWQGLSPLTSLMDALKLDRYQSRYLQGYFGRDNAIPTAIISVAAETNEYDFELIKEQIRSQFGEGRRSAIIRAGDMDVKTITQTLREMEIINARKFNREEINHVIGIPDGLISGSASGDSRLSTEITFVRNTVQPFLDMLAADFSNSIAAYYGNGVVIAAPNIIPQDRALKVQEYTQYSQDRSINENRVELNLPPVSVLETVNFLNEQRLAVGLEPITTPYDDIMLELMLNMPTRTLAYLSSNTFSGASKTGLRVGQIDAGGNPVEDPMAAFEDPAAPPATGSNGSTATDSNEPPAKVNAKKEPKAPDMPGLRGPKNEAGKESVREWPEHRLVAYRLGLKEELKRWQKIAAREAKDGKDAGDRIFVSDCLSSNLTDTVLKKLKGKDEVGVRLMFDTLIDMVDIVEL